MRTLCVFLIIVVVVVLIENSTAAECIPGTRRRQRCNTCYCTPAGAWACTLTACRTKRATRCTPGETFKQDCNTCFCSQDGQTAACTLNLCV